MDERYIVTIEGPGYQEPIRLEFDKLDFTHEASYAPIRHEGALEYHEFQPGGRRISLRAWDGQWEECAGLLPEIVLPRSET